MLPMTSAEAAEAAEEGRGWLRKGGFCEDVCKICNMETHKKKVIRHFVED